MRILVIEDEKKVASFIKRGLEEAGYMVDIAKDGEEGIYAAESEDYDLIVLDLILPRKSGLEVCKELRATKMRVPILILSALALGLAGNAVLTYREARAIRPAQYWSGVEATHSAFHHVRDRLAEEHPKLLAEYRELIRPTTQCVPVNK